VERLGVVTHGMTEEQVDGALARKIDPGGKNCLWVVDDVLTASTVKRYGSGLRHMRGRGHLLRSLRGSIFRCSSGMRHINC
jgi:hypothetical protein